jgi:tRNA threonylcarbamoyladenosine biosynthesis protein TsaB
MKAIYLDTTKNMTIGILDENYSWLKLIPYNETKSTEGLHFKLLEMLEDLNLEIKDIGALFTVSGPGSYTGMRVSEGIAQIFIWQGIKTNSFYHFQVPELLGKEKYIFVCKAFKGEFFLKGHNEERLLNLSDLEKTLKKYRDEGIEIFSHYPEGDFGKYSFTSDVIAKESSKIFPKIFNDNVLMGPFYFRPLEKEFKVSND